MRHAFLSGYIQLGCWLLGIWFMFWVVSPLVVAHCPPLERYGNVTREINVHAGAFNYNDVPVSVDAERNNRDTVRFLPHGGIAAK